MGKIVSYKQDDGSVEVVDSGPSGESVWIYSAECAHLAEHTHPEVVALPAADLEKIRAKKK